MLVTEISHDGNYYVAHNKYYEQILVPKIDVYMGKMIEVEVVECTKFSMKGKVLQDTFDLPHRPVQYRHGQVTGVPKVSSHQSRHSLAGAHDRIDPSLILFSHCQKDSNNNEPASCVSGGCGSGENKCCSSTSEQEDRCPSLKWTTPGNLPNEGESAESDKLRQYAYAGLVAGGAILLSRIALKLFYTK